jgi:hypothetical protein
MMLYSAACQCEHYSIENGIGHCDLDKCDARELLSAKELAALTEERDVLRAHNKGLSDSFDAYCREREAAVARAEAAEAERDELDKQLEAAKRIIDQDTKALIALNDAGKEVAAQADKLEAERDALAAQLQMVRQLLTHLRDNPRLTVGPEFLRQWINDICDYPGRCPACERVRGVLAAWTIGEKRYYAEWQELDEFITDIETALAPQSGSSLRERKPVYSPEVERDLDENYE